MDDGELGAGATLRVISAIIDASAQIGERSRVWRFVHVCGEACIGKEVSLGQNRWHL